MGYIKKEIEVTGTKRCKKIQALFDSGAGPNFISSIFIDGETAEDLGILTFFEEKEVILGDNSKKSGRRVRFPNIKINNTSYENVDMILMERLSSDIIIGSFFMQKNDIILDLKNEQMIFNTSVPSR